MSETNGHGAAVPSWIAPILRSFQALTRRGLSYQLGASHDGLREMETVFGYKARLTYRDFKAAYERNDLAKRLVNVWPKATWSQAPTVTDDQDADTETPFETAWQQLDQRLGIVRHLRLLDRYAMLGHYGCLLLGLRGQGDLGTAAAPVRSPEDVLFLQPYSEEFLTIETFGTDPGDALYGKPVVYRLVGAGTSDTSDTSLRRPQRPGRLVHASRVLHLPGEDGLDDPGIYGLPILEAVYNRLQDLFKTVGAAAEIFYRDAKGRFILKARDGFTMSPEDRDFLEQEGLDFQHGFRDFMRVMGIDVDQLGGLTPHPKETFEVIMQLIAGTVGVPLRRLLGSERGELASSQDEDTYLQAVNERQVNHAQPLALDPLIRRLVALRALPEPRNNAWTVTWPNLWTLSETQQAEVMKNHAQAAQAVLAAAEKYTGVGLVGMLLSPVEVRTLLAPVWQGTEGELSPDLPPEVEEAQRLALEMPAGDDTAAEAPEDAAAAAGTEPDDTEEDAA